MVGVSNSIIDISPVWQRFLLNITEADGVNIFINYRAASADQFNCIFKIIAIIGV